MCRLLFRHALLRTAREVTNDCVLIFPFPRCDGSDSLGYINNRPINAQYYASSGAKALEVMYRNACKLQRQFDGGPVSFSCINRTCTAKAERGCL